MLWECSQGCTEERPKSKGHPGRCRKHAEAFRYTKDLKTTTSLNQKSAKRQAEEDAGTRPRRRRSTLKQGKGFAASDAQRKKIEGLVCAGCGAEGNPSVPIDPAHLWPRGKGGCDHPDCVIPLCRTCHRLFDEGKLELLERLAGTEAWAVEQAHPILAHGVSPVELVRRLSGGEYEFVKRSPERDSVAA